MSADFFEQHLPIIKDNDELEKVKKQHVDLDSIYIATACIKDRRAFIESLWNDYKEYADRNFIKEAKTIGQFNQRVWELYLGVTLLRRSYELVQTKGIGPDIHIKTERGKSIWIEATAPGRGTVDPVPSKPNLKEGEMYSGGGNIEDINRPKILRITQAIKEKNEQYKKSIKNNIISEVDPYIVAINGHDFAGVGNLPDYVLKWAFFAAGPKQYKLMLNGKLSEPSLAYRPKVEKGLKVIPR